MLHEPEVQGRKLGSTLQQPHFSSQNKQLSIPTYVGHVALRLEMRGTRERDTVGAALVMNLSAFDDYSCWSALFFRLDLSTSP